MCIHPRQEMVRFIGSPVLQQIRFMLPIHGMQENDCFFGKFGKMLWTAQMCSVAVLCGNKNEQTMERIK